MSVETPEPIDLSEDLERIAQHIPCLEKAAIAFTNPHIRAAITAELAAFRLALELAEVEK